MPFFELHWRKKAAPRKELNEEEIPSEGAATPCMNQVILISVGLDFFPKGSDNTGKPFL